MEIDFEDSSRNKLTAIDSGNVEMFQLNKKAFLSPVWIFISPHLFPLPSPAQ